MRKGITWEWASNLSVREEKKGDWRIEQLKKTSLRRRLELHEGNNAIASCRREKNLSFFLSMDSVDEVPVFSRVLANGNGRGRRLTESRNACHSVLWKRFLKASIESTYLTAIPVALHKTMNQQPIYRNRRSSRFFNHMILNDI